MSEQIEQAEPVQNIESTELVDKSVKLVPIKPGYRVITDKNGVSRQIKIITEEQKQAKKDLKKKSKNQVQQQPQTQVNLQSQDIFEEQNNGKSILNDLSAKLDKLTEYLMKNQDKIEKSEIKEVKTEIQEVKAEIKQEQQIQEIEKPVFIEKPKRVHPFYK
ncbi:Hypothetical_protein [Hexamita inflata]|uniref:Hypothetical_protein n=1 Tax=Hexamita inflata TaxID=28002 RepID=A0AA86P5K6_9EUKA|nr:Hypothetical protein HINF_LOCUS18731 [Hexamita inflata]